MDNRSDYPAKPRNLGCELFRVFSQPERNGFATGTLISPSQARRNSSRAWRVGRTEDSPDEREGGRRSALRGNGRPKGQPVSASSIPARPRSEYRVASRPPFGVTWSAYYPRWRRRRLDLLVSWRVSLPDFAPQTQLLPAVLYDAPLHGAVMAHGMTGPHHSRRPIDLRGGIGIGSLRPVARPRGHDVPGPRHAVVIFRPGRQRAQWRPEGAPVVRA